MLKLFGLIGLLLEDVPFGVEHLTVVTDLGQLLDVIEVGIVLVLLIQRRRGDVIFRRRCHVRHVGTLLLHSEPGS